MRLVYIYLVTVAVILEWRGLWNLLDMYLFNDWRTQIGMAIIALTIICLTQSSIKLVSNPFFLYMDNYQNFFTSKTKQEDEVYYTTFILTSVLIQFKRLNKLKNA
jgi:hypothetical protein